MGKNTPSFSNGTYCPYSSPEFAEETAADISIALSECRNSRMEINVYTPPYEDDQFPEGFIRLLFYQNDVYKTQIGIEFGQTDEDNEVVRCGFDREEWEAVPDDPHSAGINTVNFDEAWRLILVLSEKLSISGISMSYGC